VDNSRPVSEDPRLAIDYITNYSCDKVAESLQMADEERKQPCLEVGFISRIGQKRYSDSVQNDLHYDWTKQRYSVTFRKTY
jgi:hypothetical protein